MLSHLARATRGALAPWLFASLSTGAFAQSESGDWTRFSGFDNGCNGTVFAIERLPGGEIVVGGSFSQCGNTPANSLALFSPSAQQWFAFGPGISNTVRALAVSGDSLWVGGEFLSAGGLPASHLARYDLTSNQWSIPGFVSGSYINAVEVIGSDVYVGGHFSAVGGVSANGLARISASIASVGGFSGSVLDLTQSGGQLYVAGQSMSVSGTTLSSVARFSGSAWQDLNAVPAGGLINWVNKLTAHGGEVFAAGDFVTFNGQTANHLVRYNVVGGTWSTLAGGISHSLGVRVGVDALHASGDGLYVGGNFDTAGSIATPLFARFNAGVWQNPASTRPESRPFAFASGGGQLFVGGGFRRIGAQRISGIAALSSGWSSLGSNTGNGIDGHVYAITTRGNAIIAGGDFRQTATTPARSIACWNGTAWQAFGAGEGFDGNVRALTFVGDELWAGGEFDSFNGSSMASVARWTGSTFVGVGPNSFRPQVRKLLATPLGIFALGGPIFRTYGGATYNGIARFDGSAWQPLGSGATAGFRKGGLDGTPWDMVFHNGSLYISGDFDSAGGVPVLNFARWDGTAFSAVPGTSVEPMSGLALLGNQLYASTVADTIIPGNSRALRTLDLTTQQWAATQLFRTDATLLAIGALGVSMYAGGAGTQANVGALNFNRLVRAIPSLASLGAGASNGVSDSFVGNPETSQVNVLHGSNGRLIVGGKFTFAGGLPSPNLAVWNPGGGVVFASGFESSGGGGCP